MSDRITILVDCTPGREHVSLDCEALSRVVVLCGQIRETRSYLVGCVIMKEIKSLMSMSDHDLREKAAQAVDAMIRRPS